MKNKLKIKGTIKLIIRYLFNGFSQKRGSISRLISPDSSGSVRDSINKIFRFLDYYENKILRPPSILLNFGCGKEVEETVAVGMLKKCDVYLVDIFSYGFSKEKFNQSIRILNRDISNDINSHVPLYFYAKEIDALEVKKIDYIFSCAVLEHLSAQTIGECLQAMKEKLSPGGIMVHEVDFSDHLTGAAATEWRNNYLFKKFNTVYVNQLTPLDILSIFKDIFDSSFYTFEVYEYINATKDYIKLESLDAPFKSLVYQYRVFSK